MSVDKRPDGKYRARVRQYAGGPEATKHFKRKVDADRWEAEQRTAIARGTYLTADQLRITLGQYVAAHLARQMWRERTVDLARNALGRAEAHFGSSRPLSAIRRSDVESYVVKLSKDLAPSTVRVQFQHFRTLMRSALADGIIAVDPTMKIKMPASAPDTLVVPSPEQVGGLIEAASEMFGTAVLLGAQVGLRVGEAQGLAVSDIDFLRRTINVRRQLDGRSTALLLGPTKTAASTRSIPVPRPLLDALALHVERHGPGRDDVLLHNGGEYLSDNRFTQQWRAAQVGIGLKAGALRFHWLRHSFASSLISAGCSVKAVANAMGHANPTVTLTTYASLWPGDEDRIRTAIEASWKIADQLRTGTAE